MTDYLIYLTQVSICFSILYLVYVMALQSLTFHRLNRLVLLLLLPLSLAIPLLDSLVPPLALSQQLPIPAFEELLFHPAVGYADNSPSTNTAPLSPYNLLLFTYWLGFSIALLRLFLGALKLFQLKRTAQVLQQGDEQLLIARVPAIFSCFHWIFVPKEKVNAYTEPILLHEKAHSQLGHTYDLLLIEIYAACCWFNPFVYSFRKSLRSLHEFQADEAVLRTSIKKSTYLRLLLIHLKGDVPGKLYSYFNHPIMKKRIEMMTQSTSPKSKSIRYVLLLPMLALLSMAFINSDNISVLPQATPIQQTLIGNPPKLFPLANHSNAIITAPFGKEFKTHLHKEGVVHGGIDIRAAIGEPVIATASGTIATAANQGDWGNLIIITHTDGFETRYAHLNGFEVVKDQMVKAGDVIGYTGNTGKSTGPHLHYEVRQHGKRLNPMDYFER